MNRKQIAKARKIIADNIYMTIATSTGKGNPWITPVSFAYDSRYTLYFVSAKNSKHSKLISKNNHVAVVIYDSSVPEGEGDAVYLVGRASEISEEKQLKNAIAVVYSRKQKSKSQYDKKVRTVKDFTGSSPWRMYGIVPERFWTLKNSVKIKGYLTDLREEIKLGS